MRTHRRRTVIALALVSVMLFVVGCHGEGHTPPQAQPPPDDGIAANGVIIPDDGSVVTRVDEEQYTFTGDAPDITVGDIITGSANNGYLRKVTSTQNLAEGVVVQTSDASLDEVIENGSVTSTVLLDSSNMVATSGLSPQTVDTAYVIDPLTIYQDDGVELSITSGHVDFEPQLETHLNYVNGELQHFTISVSGTLEVEMAFEATAHIKHNLPICREQDIIVPVSYTFVQFIGIWPVWETVTMTIKAGVDLENQVTGTIAKSVQGSASLTAGLAYQKPDTWTPIGNSNLTIVPGPTDLKLDGKLELRAYVRPELTVLFYSVAGPGLNIEPYLRYDAAYSATQLDWAFYGGLDANVFAKLQILGKTIAQYPGSGEPDEVGRIIHLETLILSGQEGGAGEVPVVILDAPKGRLIRHVAN